MGETEKERKYLDHIMEFGLYPKQVSLKSLKKTSSKITCIVLHSRKVTIATGGQELRRRQDRRQVAQERLEKGNGEEFGRKLFHRIR